MDLEKWGIIVILASYVKIKSRFQALCLNSIDLYLIVLFYYKVAEMRGQYEVQLDDFKLTVVRLKAQLRLRCSSQPLQDIFDSFEAHTQR